MSTVQPSEVDERTGADEQVTPPTGVALPIAPQGLIFVSDAGQACGVDSCG